MNQSKTDNFLDDLLSKVKFKFARAEIRKELEDHIEGRIDYYMERGYSRDEAEIIAVDQMGDPFQIGYELNQQHKPVYGWIILLTNFIIVMILMFYIMIFILFIPVGIESGLYKLSKFDLSEDHSVENLEYEMDIYESANIDSTKINFEKVIRKKNGDINIIGSLKDKSLKHLNMNFLRNIKVSDSEGREYYLRLKETNSKYFDLEIEDFPKNQEEIILSYNRFNRNFQLIIPLRVGESDES